MTKYKAVIYTFLSLTMLLPYFSGAEESIMINEIAWMGTNTYHGDEWLELFNPTGQNIDLAGWNITAVDGSPSITLEGTVPTNGYFLLERSDDTTVPGILADQIYTGALSNSGEHLKLFDNQGNLVDEVNASDGWPAGDNNTKQTMEWTGSGWTTSLNPGGTPRAQNSVYSTGDQQTQEENQEQEQPPPEDPPDSDPLSQNQSPSNQPPKAKVSANKTDVVVSEEIAFDASGSSDIDGDTLSFSWNFGDGNKSQDEITTHSYSEPGTYNAVLMVNDGKLESYGYLTITVTAAPSVDGASLAPKGRESLYSKHIFINEFIPNPAGSDTKNEWVELANESDVGVLLKGWQIDDIEGGSNPFTIPEGTVINANSFLILSRPQTKIALNNDGDMVRLLWPNGFIAHEVSYNEKVKEGWSAIRLNEIWEWTSSPTPGSRNILSQETNNVITKKDSLDSSSTLTSTVNPLKDTKTANDQDVRNRVSNIENTSKEGLGSKPESQKAEIKSAFSISGTKYFSVGLALVVSLMGAVAMFILKRRLKDKF